MNKTSILRAGLTALRYVGADSFGPHLTNRIGAIFMLHHVAPETGRQFEPNRILRITPEFLEEVVREVKDAGFEIVSMDDLPNRVENASTQAPFACFTFDDGYRDNIENALPVFRRHNIPFTVYVPTDFMDGKGNLWWLALERAIDSLDTVSLKMDEVDRHFETRTTKEKYAAFEEIYWWLRRIPEDEARTVVHDLAQIANFDDTKLCRELAMTWDELREFAKDPLVTIGAHTKGHYALAKLPDAQAFEEMKGSIDRIEQELGTPCHHFSYPYGDINSAGPREFVFAEKLGVTTAVTTQKI